MWTMGNLQIKPEGARNLRTSIRPAIRQRLGGHASAGEPEDHILGPRHSCTGTPRPLPNHNATRVWIRNLRPLSLYRAPPAGPPLAGLCGSATATAAMGLSARQQWGPRPLLLRELYWWGPRIRNRKLGGGGGPRRLSSPFLLHATVRERESNEEYLFIYKFVFKLVVFISRRERSTCPWNIYFIGWCPEVWGRTCNWVSDLNVIGRVLSTKEDGWWLPEGKETCNFGTLQVGKFYLSTADCSVYSPC